MFHRPRRPAAWKLFSAAALILVSSHSAAAHRHKEKRIPISISPSQVSIVAGATQSFTAALTNDSRAEGVVWSLSTEGEACADQCGTLSGQQSNRVTYRAPRRPRHALTLTLIATSVRDPRRTASVIITIPPVPELRVAISPARGGLAVGQSVAITAVVTSDIGDSGVAWAAYGENCDGSSCGTFINSSHASATYTAPSVPGVYRIEATSIAEPWRSASATFGVTDLAGVTTYHNALTRDGANTQEYALTKSLVSQDTFGKLFSCGADAAIYTQPLWVPQVTIGGAPHNIIVVATQNDSVYAFDADASPCITLWQANLLDAAHGGTAGETAVPTELVGSNNGNISPIIGVTATPVIDPATNSVYVVSKSVNTDTQFFQRLHALDLASGNEKVSSQAIDASITVPGTGDGSVNGVVPFDPRNENARAGLVFYKGVVYVSWASHEDHDPYHGWVIGFDAATLAPLPNAIFNSTPNAVGTVSYSRGGIWMGGGAPAIDADGNLYLITGNGTFDANTGGANYGDSLLKFSTANGLSVADYFTPLDEATLDANDQDFGSGAATILIDPARGHDLHFVIGGGKEGYLFLLDRNNLGRFNPGSNNAIQAINVGSGIFATPAFWRDNLYVGPIGALQQFVFDPQAGVFGGSASSQTEAIFPYPGTTPSISARGNREGVLWASDNSRYCTQYSPGCGPAVLHAYDAENLAIELWNSAQAAGNRDEAGDAVKFTVPTVANGKVYLGTRGNNGTVPGELDVFGLLPN